MLLEVVVVVFDRGIAGGLCMRRGVRGDVIASHPGGPVYMRMGDGIVPVVLSLFLSESEHV